MHVSRDLIPMALLALATLVAVGAIVLLGELLRRGILALLSALLPAQPTVAPADDDRIGVPLKRGEVPPAVDPEPGA
jgi:hypothetical protein